MTMEQMSAIVDTIRTTWEATATEHPDISALFEHGAPYLTIWDGNRCQCKHGRILEKVYVVPGHRRTAQAFLFLLPGQNDEDGLDVFNVHAPSGNPKLTDSQRYHLIRNMLQSSSMTRPNKRIGECRFLLGGDMNTIEKTFSQILIKLRIFDILIDQPHYVLAPAWGKHGDMCVVGGFTTTLVPGRGRNHDPDHEPYGIVWPRFAQPATEQLKTMPQTRIPTAPDTQKEPAATGSIAAATTVTSRTTKRQPHRNTASARSIPEQPQPFPEQQHRGGTRHEIHWPQLSLEKPTASAWPATEQSDGYRGTTEQSQADTEEPPTQKEPEQTDAVTPKTKVSLDVDSETTRHATEQPRPDGNVVCTQADAQITQLTTEQSQSDTDEPLTRKGSDQMDAPNLKTTVSLDTDPETTRHATEQPRLDEIEFPELNGPEQEIIYVIVNAFLGNITFESTPAEVLIKRIILSTDNPRIPWPSDMLHNIDEVFRPIFVHYPNGLSDRSRSEPRDAIQYIRQWRELAEWRQRGGSQLSGFPGSELADSHVQSILHQYIDNFIKYEADALQKAQTWTKNKSRAEARLHRLCGSVPMAKAIWQVGIPNIPEATFPTDRVLATEQQRRLGHDSLNSIADATDWIMKWLNMISRSIQSHKATPGYQEHARKSGTQKNQSGLTATELRMKEEKKHEAQRKYGRRHS